MGFTDRKTGYSGNGFVRLRSSSRSYNRTTSGYPCMLTDCRENPLKTLTVYGNSVQSGTPSVDTPAEIMGVGDRTKNLFDNTKLTVGYLNAEGVITQLANNSWSISDYIPVNPQASYSVGIYSYGGTAYNAWYDSGYNLISVFPHTDIGTVSTAIAPQNAAYLRISVKTTENEHNTVTVVEGSYTAETMPLYEPYGYKLPLIMSGENGEMQSFEIYLNEQLNKVGNICDTVELDFENKSAVLTKRIGHLLFNGDEGWANEGTNTSGIYRYRIAFDNYIPTDHVSNSAICTHFTTNTSSPTWTIENTFALASGAKKLYIRTDGLSVEIFKEWLKEQYAAGTPVEIYYRYETPIVTDISDKINWDTIPKLWKGTVTITSGTQIPLSNVEAEYYATKK